MGKLRLTRGRLFRVKDNDHYFIFLKQHGRFHCIALECYYSEEDDMLRAIGITDEPIERKKIYLPHTLPGKLDDYKELFKL